MADIGTKRVVVECPMELYGEFAQIVADDDTTDISKTLRGLMHEFVEKHKKSPKVIGKTIKTRLRRRN